MLARTLQMIKDAGAQAGIACESWEHLLKQCKETLLYLCRLCHANEC